MAWRDALGHFAHDVSQTVPAVGYQALNSTSIVSRQVSVSTPFAH